MLKKNKVLNFCKEVLVMHAALAFNFMEKFPEKSTVVRFAICRDPNYMANMEDRGIKAFGLS